MGRANRRLPSLMLAIPGCWACEEMGALLAGVFCGVLLKNQRVKAEYLQYLSLTVPLEYPTSYCGLVLTCCKNTRLLEPSNCWKTKVVVADKVFQVPEVSWVKFKRTLKYRNALVNCVCC